MDDYRLILTIGGVIASLATAWGVAKNQLKAIISDVRQERLFHIVRTLEKRIERLENKT